MNDVQDDGAASQKRKVSESLEPEDGSAKRLRIDSAAEQGSNVDGSNGHKGRSEDATIRNDAVDFDNRLPPERPTSSSSKVSREDDVPDARPPSADQRTQQSAGTGTGRRPDYRLEDKRRGQRLFGGLLSALNQNKPSTHQVKRLEIERRQQERAHQQRLEDDKRRAEKLAKLTSIRMIEQVKFDEQVMETRHVGLLAMANSLQTRSKPRICYRPWLLTERQEQMIKDQIRETEEIIEKEVRDFKQQKEQRLKELGALDSLPESYDVGEPSPSKDTNPRPPESKTAHERDPDEMGDDEMEQDKEDAVLY